MFCRCENVWGEEPNTRTCPVCLAHPGTLPVPEPDGDRVGGQARPRARLRDRRALALPPQELLLSRPAEGLPDLPVRRPARLGRALRRARAGRRPRDRDRPRAPRGGRRQDRPRRRRRRADPRRRVLARRLQPRRHAARRDRRRARRPLGRGGAALPPAPAPDGRRARHLRRGDGEGIAALRRQRLRAPGRRGGLPHEDRAQEHELLQVRRRRDRGRGRAPDRDLRGRRRGRPADAPLRPAAGHDRAAPLEGGGARLPLLPRARPRGDRAARRAGRARPRRDRRAARRAHPPARAGGRLRPRLRPRHERPRRALRARARRRPPRRRQRAHEPARRGRGRPGDGGRRRARQADRRARDASRARRSSTRSPRAATPASRPSATSARRRSRTPPSSTR